MVGIVVIVLLVVVSGGLSIEPFIILLDLGALLFFTLFCPTVFLSPLCAFQTTTTTSLVIIIMFFSLMETLTTPAAVAAFLSTGLISLVPNVLLFLFPALTKTATATAGSSGVWWQWGQALAAGGLLGDVFLHTLPHANAMRMTEENEKAHQRDHHDDHDDSNHDHARDNGTGLWILAGFFVFFIVDVFLRMAEDMMHGNSNNNHNQQDDDNNSKNHSHSHSHAHNNSSDHKSSNGTIVDDKNESTARTSSSSTTTTSWSLLVLNLTADALHNFTDGLAIGASYASAAATTTAVSPGSVATLSILLHEVPHELGDYCTLVSAGYTPWQAVRMQFVTAIAAFVGTAVALVLSASSTSSSSESSSVVSDPQQSILLLGTAGGFLYLAATTLLPHVLSEPVNKPWHRLGHLVAFSVGLAFMYGVAFLEEQEEHHDHDHHLHHDEHEHHHREL